MLIGDEPEPGMENLREVDVPEKMSEQFNKADQQEIQEIEAEMKGTDKQ